jgi:hypothetical protein
VIGRKAVLEVCEQLGELLGEVVGRSLPSVALERERGQWIGARRAADPQVDTTGEQRREDRERLCHLERAVMGQHHSTASDADLGSSGGDRPDQRLRAGARQHWAAVMLGHPITVVAEVVGEPSEVERVSKRIDAGRTLGDRRLVEYGETHLTDSRDELVRAPEPGSVRSRACR